MIRDDLKRFSHLANILMQEDIEDLPVERPNWELSEKEFDLLIEKIESYRDLSKSEIVFLIDNMPQGYILDDYSSLLISIIVKSDHFPMSELWETRNLNNVHVHELKLSAFNSEFHKLNSSNGIKFSFTNEIFFALSQSIQFMNIAKNMNLVDIDNMLLIVSLLSDEGNGEYIPSGFDKEIVRCIKKENYTFSNKGQNDWRNFYVYNFENVEMPELKSLIESLD